MGTSRTQAALEKCAEKENKVADYNNGRFQWKWERNVLGKLALLFQLRIS